MANSFLEKFSKYTPSDSERAILESVTDYSIKLDKEARIISCNVRFSSYVPFATLERIENAIKEAYTLSLMEIHPSFENTPFDIAYMEHVFYESTRRDFLGNGFLTGAILEKLDDSEISAENGVLHISLKHGGRDLLVENGYDRLLSQIISEMFGEKHDIDFCGITEMNYEDINSGFVLPEIPYFPPEAYNSAPDEASIPESTMKYSVSKLEPVCSFDEDTGIVSSGGMMFDISEIENVYKKIKDINVSPIRNAVIGNDHITVCGEVFGYEKKLTKKGDKCIVSFFVTDNDSSIVVKMFYELEKDAEYGKISDGKSIIMKGSAKIDKFDDGIDACFKLRRGEEYHLILVYAPQAEGIDADMPYKIRCDDDWKSVPIKLLNEPACDSALIELESTVRLIAKAQSEDVQIKSG